MSNGIYKVSIPSLQKAFVTNSIDSAIKGALAALNFANDKVNVFQMCTPDLVKYLYQFEKVVTYNHFGDMVAIERIREVENC